MANHKNFYETIKEARMRLQHSVVMYDGEPYYVLCVEDHKPDGIYRVYMDKLGQKGGMTHARERVPYEYIEDDKYSTIGEQMDAWLDKNADKGVVRKMANSPLFNKYRPFAIGMINCDQSGQVYYGRRGPTRHSQQGLTSSMFSVRKVELLGSPSSSGGGLSASRVLSFVGDGAYLCYTNQYPTFDEVVTNLNDPATENNAAAFHREFAVLRGPIDMMFLAYREDIIGYMPKGDASELILARNHGYCKEVVEDLGIFTTVTTKK